MDLESTLETIATYAEGLSSAIDAVSSRLPEGLDLKGALSAAVDAIPAEVRKKMRRTITRIVNEGKGGVICILL